MSSVSSDMYISPCCLNPFNQLSASSIGSPCRLSISAVTPSAHHSYVLLTEPSVNSNTYALSAL